MSLQWRERVSVDNGLLDTAILKEQSKIKLRALALSILNINYTLEIALRINNQLKN